jgi:hypothetical protein
MDTSTYYIFQFFIQQSNKNNKQSYYKEVYLAHPVECLKTGINLFLPSVPTVFSLIMYISPCYISISILFPIGFELWNQLKYNGIVSPNLIAITILRSKSECHPIPHLETS